MAEVLAGRLVVLPTAQAMSVVGNWVKSAVEQGGLLLGVGRGEEMAVDIVVFWGLVGVLLGFCGGFFPVFHAWFILGLCCEVGVWEDASWFWVDCNFSRVGSKVNRLWWGRSRATQHKQSQEQPLRFL